ncbi:MAG TPA: TonB family protein [Opitutaceae bacterium]|nr:TonB family protein [Opitutaceae bacterium]
MNTITFDGGVKRQFALPAAIVLSAHAAFFLGFVKQPPVTPVMPAYTVIHFDPPPPPLIDESGRDANKPANNSSPQQQQAKIVNPIQSTEPETSKIPITVSWPNHGPIFPDSGFSGNLDSGTGPGVQDYSPDVLDHTPEAVRQSQPIYPINAKNTGENGEVVVTFVVDESGRVLNPHVVSSTDPIFEEPTVRAIGQWRFAPGTVHGIPVRFRMSLPVTFHLES